MRRAYGADIGPANRTEGMTMKREDFAWLMLLLAILMAGADLGGSFYEHALVFPAWSADPPRTLALIQPEHGGISLIRFWIPMHSALTLTLIVALVLNWKNRRVRNLLFGAIGAYAVMRAWTFAYFVPEITAFVQMSPKGPSSPELAERAARWGMLSHGRTVLVAIMTGLLIIAAMPGRRREGA